MRYEQKEKWKYVKGFDREYKVSTTGIVMSKKYGKYRKLKTYLCGPKGKKYEGIDLCKEGKPHKFKMHRLVAIHFKKNPRNLPEVNHEDGNKLNNNAYNLKWTDGVGNMKHAREKLGFNNKGENSPNSKLTTEDVIEIIRLFNTGMYSCRQISLMYKLHERSAWGIVNRKTWKHLKIA